MAKIMNSQSLADYLQEQKRIAQSLRDKLLAREKEIIAAWAGKVKKVVL